MQRIRTEFSTISKKVKEIGKKIENLVLGDEQERLRKMHTNHGRGCSKKGPIEIIKTETIRQPDLLYFAPVPLEHICTYCQECKREQWQK